MTLLENIDEFLTDLLERRGKATVSGDSDRTCIEMSGGHVVEMTPFEPDALTFRNWYYYNTKTNTLMRKIVNKSTATAFWKRVGG